MASIVPTPCHRVSMIQSIINAICCYFFKTLDTRQYQGHFGQEQRLATENREELETHGYQDRAHQQEAHHHQRHHVVMSTTVAMPAA